MRFVFSINFNKNQVISLNDVKSSGLRNAVISVIKEALKQKEVNLFQEYWGNKSKNIVKPFTFAYYANKLKQEKSKSCVNYQFEGDLRVNVSSHDYSFLVAIYNSLIKLKEYQIFGEKINLCQFSLRQQKDIDSNKVLFKILSPFVVRKTENKKGNGYLSIEDSDFEESLFYQVKNLSANYLKIDLDRNQFSIETEQCKTIKITHYKEIIPATSGQIKIKAPVEVLKLLYDSGLGARRSQGFGMLEVIR
ncbi:MAG: CRISPR-associated endoribonuclease Cas6 [Spirochaetota bacterium]|nr:CRISPR-associated endoribonuclease Cas6 [Spirochaetota bacterium]